MPRHYAAPKLRRCATRFPLPRQKPMGGPTWTPYELDTLSLLAGDVPWPALPLTY